MLNVLEKEKIDDKLKMFSLELKNKCRIIIGNCKADKSHNERILSKEHYILDFMLYFFKT